MYGGNAPIPIIILNSLPNVGFNSECVLRKVRRLRRLTWVQQIECVHDQFRRDDCKVSAANALRTERIVCDTETAGEISFRFGKAIYKCLQTCSKRNLQFHEYLRVPPDEEPKRQQINSIQVSVFHQHTAETFLGQSLISFEFLSALALPGKWT